jgi:putative spermidine/putrescine transport system permease protein
MTRILGRLLVILAYGFVLSPILFVIVVSFSRDAYIVFPPSGWSLSWYAALLSQQEFGSALVTSLGIAVIASLLSLAIALPASHAVSRRSTAATQAAYALLTAPQMIPSVILGLALLLVFAPQHLAATWSGVVLAHILVTLPFAVRILVTTFATISADCEAAAATLGAAPFTVFRRVTLPLALPGVLAALVIAFIVSFDDTVVTLFLSGPRFTTLPVRVFNYVSTKTDPLVAALSTALLVATALLITAVERSIGVMRVVGR